MKRETSPEQLAERLLGRPFEKLDAEEQRILCRLGSDDIELEDEETAMAQATFGDRLADVVARVGGSWPFIALFILVILAWMLLNSHWAGRFEQTWDAYPYVFLNYVLSLTAALQAPIIMMSQNRQAAKDRITNRHDYEINLRTTMEILAVDRKVDDMAERLERIEAALDRTRERAD